MREQNKSIGFIADDDSLNLSAFRACMGYSATPERDLALLLRSNVPIHWAVIRALADALEGKSLLGCEVHFKSKNIKRAKSHDARKLWFEVGTWMQKQSGAYDGVVGAAATHFNQGTKYCQKALTYARQVNAWVESVMLVGTYYGTWEADDLAAYYIKLDADQESPPPNRTLEAVYDQDVQDQLDLRLLFRILDERRQRQRKDTDLEAERLE